MTLQDLHGYTMPDKSDDLKKKVKKIKKPFNEFRRIKVLINPQSRIVLT